MCDSWSDVNVMSKTIAEKLRINRIQPPKMTLTFANFSRIPELHVCVKIFWFMLIFKLWRWLKSLLYHWFLEGHSWLYIVGAIIDLFNKWVSFANIDKKVFYKAILTSRMQRHECCIIVDVVHIKEVSEKRDVKEILDGDSQVNVSEQPSTKVKRERQKDQGRFFWMEIQLSMRWIAKEHRNLSLRLEYYFHMSSSKRDKRMWEACWMAFWSSACPTVELILEKVLILNPVDFHFKVELKTLYNNFVGDEPLVVSVNNLSIFVLQFNF